VELAKHIPILYAFSAGINISIYGIIYME